MKKIEFEADPNSQKGRYETQVELIIKMLFRFLSEPYVTMSKIMSDLEISRRTFYRYRKVLENAGVYMKTLGNGQLSLDEEKTVLRLDRMSLNEDETLSFIIAGYLIENYSDFSVQDNFSNAMQKIRASLRYRNRQEINELLQKTSTKKRIPYHTQRFPHNYLLEIQRAIVKHKIIHIKYYTQVSHF